jgi:hypothetical protein
VTLRRAYFIGLGLIGMATAVVAACTGDDPAPAVAPDDDAGDSSPSRDASDEDSSSTTDAPSDGGADAPFSPTAFGGRLVLWYEASAANLVLSDAGDGTVVVWKDKSAAKLDAKQTLKAQGAPTATPDDAGGSRNFVTFTSDTQQLGNDNDQTNLYFGAREFVVEVVASMNPAALSANVPIFARRQGMFGHDGQLRLSLELGHVIVAVKPDDAGLQSLTSTNASMDDLSLHAIGMRRIKQAALPKDTFQLRIDGAHEEFQMDPVNLDLAGADFLFGGDYPGVGPNHGFELSIAEVIVIASQTAVPIADSEIAALEAYLKAKYALP